MDKQEYLRRYCDLDWRLYPYDLDTSKAMFEGWQELAAADIETVMGWHKKWPDAGWGRIIPAGEIVIDMDVKNGKDGIEQFSALSNDAMLPETPTALTINDGMHLILSVPKDLQFRKRKYDLAPGLELLAAGWAQRLPTGDNGREWMLYPWETGKVFWADYIRERWQEVELASVSKPIEDIENHPLRPTLEHIIKVTRAKPSGTGWWAGHCPAHDDKNPSFSFTLSSDRIGFYCFAGCDPADITRALELGDLQLNIENVKPRIDIPQTGRVRYTMADIAVREIPENPFLLDGLIFEAGITIAAGDFGVGKTIGGIDMGIGVATGSPAWGRDTKQRKVMYYGMDNSIDDLTDYSRKLCRGKGIEYPRDSFTFDCTALDLSDSDTYAFLRNDILNNGWGLVFLDVLAVYLGELNENDNSHAASVLAKLRTISNETRCAFMPAHHLNKPSPYKGQSRRYIDRIRGAGAWVGGADSALAFIKRGEGENTTRELHQVKVRRKREMDAVGFNITEDDAQTYIRLTFTDIDPQVAETTLAETAAGLIVGILENSPGEQIGRDELLARLKETDMELKDKTASNAFKIVKQQEHIYEDKDPQDGRKKVYAFDAGKTEIEAK